MPQLLPPPKFRAVDGDGNPLVGGKLYTYIAGTTTPKDTYTTYTKVAANTNPVILDTRGEASVWLDGAYKVRLRDADDNLIWEVDDVRDLTSSQTFTNSTLAGTLTVTSTAVTWSGNPTHSGNHTFTSDVTVNGNTTLGNASTDTLTLNPSSISVPNNATFSGGTVTFTPPNGSFTPAVTFGGAAVGVGYNINRGGRYRTIGGLEFFYLRLRLSAKGSSTGSVRITGLPAAPAGSNGLVQWPLSITASSMTGLTGALYACAVDSSTNIFLLQAAADGTTTDVTDANFTDTTNIYISGFYPV